MAIALIVEDGSNVADANTFQDVACFKAFAESRMGLEAVLNMEAADMAKALATAFDLMDSLLWLGTRAFWDQHHAWPRICVTDRRGREHVDYTIPDGVKYGQARIAAALLDGRLVVPGMAAPAKVTSISADGVSVQFASPVLAGATCAAASTDDPMRVCGLEMLILTRSHNRSLQLARA